MSARACSASQKNLSIAIAGFGTVGGGLVRIIQENRDIIRARTDRDITIHSIAVRDTSKTRAVPLPSGCTLTTDPLSMVTHPEVDVVVELMGGTDVAYELITAALRAGKHVVTANKALLAERGQELFALAAANKLHLAHEAAICGAIPIVQTLKEGLAGNLILSLCGILNGTSNYILSEMAASQLDFATALRQAQELGYAEADPTLDIGGFDAAHKLSLLIRLAWGQEYPFAELPVQGIAQVDPMDITFAKEFSYTLKLLGVARFVDGKLEAGVYPTLVHDSSLLANVNGAFNAVLAEGNASGPIFIHGKGAGDLPTASAVLADLLHIARDAHTNNTGFISALPPANSIPSAEVQAQYYFRIMVPDHPGVLRDVAATMAEYSISIAQAIQKGKKDIVPIVIMTHEAKAKNITAALQSLEKAGLLKAAPVFYRVL